MTTKGSVYVAMSGGVDSSVSAAMLKEEGYDVTGIFIRVWHPEWLPCDWRAERQDAMRVCSELDIEFKTLDLSEKYKKDVVDYMIREYEEGRTPNPDVMCNKEIKFGAFFDWAKKQGADYIATGHYAMVNYEKDIYYLKAGVDNNKDQSYFLWTLTQKILSNTLFPVGDLLKSEVRERAKKYNLPIAEKKDSQGVCFLGKIDMREFLQHYIDSETGDVLDVSGNVIGKHEGAVLYTIGQRHGFTINTQVAESKPQYVISKDIEKNILTVSNKEEIRKISSVQDLRIERAHWIAEIPEKEETYSGRIRYRQTLQDCDVSEYDSEKCTARILFKSAQEGVAQGQSFVIYDGEVCLGGGVIQSAS